jgi:S-adenosylmethionine:tRNA-ribosyltransferase-isomerase (queuine synthetase)
MAAVPLQTQVIRLYSRILKVGRSWQAQDKNETKVERQYIQDEAKLLFRKNKNLKNTSDIQQSLVEAEARLTMAEHYGNPYPRPVNLPKTSFSKREGKKVGKAIQKMNEMSRPVYIRSSDDAVRKDK